MSIIRFSLVLAFTWLPAPFVEAANTCGASIGDWCTGPKDGPCGRHLDEAACRADSNCVAMRYSGESVVACRWDERGFADNCPAVGCKPR